MSQITAARHHCLTAQGQKHAPRNSPWKSPWKKVGPALSAIALLGLSACSLEPEARHGNYLRPDLSADGKPATGPGIVVQEVARTSQPGLGPAMVPQAPTPPPVTTPQSMDPAASTRVPAVSSSTHFSQDFSQESTGRGSFRVGNQTEHPIRIAFLPQSPDLLSERLAAAELDAPSEGIASEDPDQLAIDLEPFHWDFAPGEGSSDGLLLSLPGGDLDLQQGDVLVAFAQDGSSRYWGPYVVGQTQLPYWNRDRQEWQLLIQP